MEKKKSDDKCNKQKKEEMKQNKETNSKKEWKNGEEKKIEENEKRKKIKEKPAWIASSTTRTYNLSPTWLGRSGSGIRDESSSLAPSAPAGDSSAHCVTSMGLAQQRTLAAAARLIAGYRCPLDRWLPLDLFFFILKTATVQTISLRKNRFATVCTLVLEKSSSTLKISSLNLRKKLIVFQKSSSSLKKVPQDSKKFIEIFKKFIDLKIRSLGLEKSL